MEHTHIDMEHTHICMCPYRYGCVPYLYGCVCTCMCTHINSCTKHITGEFGGRGRAKKIDFVCGGFEDFFSFLENMLFRIGGWGRTHSCSFVPSFCTFVPENQKNKRALIMHSSHKTGVRVVSRAISMFLE